MKIYDRFITVKPQHIRLLDVVAIGPLMVWAATSKDLPGWARYTLGVFGISTIIFNGINYLHIKKLHETSNGWYE